eukprot:364784-Chlamydomonas_euryale.AAC.20
MPARRPAPRAVPRVLTSIRRSMDASSHPFCTHSIRRSMDASSHPFCTHQHEALNGRLIPPLLRHSPR